MPSARAALPGYNALTDTDLDHFSLYSDIDNVLIKRQSQGSGTLDPEDLLTVNHNLGYIPFWATFGELDTGVWGMLNNEYNAFEVPGILSASDTENVYINTNRFVNLNYAYDVFYDDMSQSGTPSITESNRLFKVARPGKTTNSTNPNDYVMHSDLNNFKILKQATVSKTLTFGTNTIAHGLTVNEPCKGFVFVNFASGGATLISGITKTPARANVTSAATNGVVAWMDTTNIYIYSYYDGSMSTQVCYVIYGTGADGTVENSGPLIACAADGKNALTETNPDNYNFHSKYPTLKYFINGGESHAWAEGDDLEVITVPHNLGYYPFFIAYINDFSGLTPAIMGSAGPVHATAPFYWGRSSIAVPNNDIGANAYVDATNLYLVLWKQSGVSGEGTINAQFYYKIFKNNLGFT
jgi:hypothetical protein